MMGTENAGSTWGPASWGRARAMVTATGMNTEMAMLLFKILRRIRRHYRKAGELGKIIAAECLVICALSLLQVS